MQVIWQDPRSVEWHSGPAAAAAEFACRKPDRLRTLMATQRPEPERIAFVPWGDPQPRQLFLFDGSHRALSALPLTFRRRHPERVTRWWV